MRLPDRKKIIEKQAVPLMGKRCEISVVTDDKEWASNVIESAVLEIRRIERLLTSINGNSQVYQVNRYAGEKPVRVDPEFFYLLRRSLKLSEATKGAFDVTRVFAENGFWHSNVMRAAVKPERGRSESFGDYQQIELDKKAMTVFLKEKGMRICFGDFGRGYAADRARLVLEENGICGGVVNVGGSLVTWGNQVDGSAWTICKANPKLGYHPFSYYNISNMAVATGTYDKNGQADNTGNVEARTNCTGTGTTTLICPTTEIANALACAISGFSFENGLQLINGYKNIACLVTGKTGARNQA